MPKPVIVTPKQDLKTRMARAVIGKGASLIPVAKEVVPPPAKQEKEEVPDLKQVITNAAERLKVTRLVSQLGEINKVESAIKKTKAPIVNDLKILLGSNHVARAKCGDYKINYFNAPRKTLDVGLLLAHGVTKDIIDASYKQTDAYTLKVSAVSGDEDEE